MTGGSSGGGGSGGGSSGPRRFARLIGNADPAMVVVTTAAGGERAGCLVGFHAQCSIDPPRYAVWLSKANRTFRIAVEAGWFAVHLLAAGDHVTAELFGGTTGDELDKFEACEWDEGPSGVPLLRACPHRFTARRLAMLDQGGDHVCFVLEPSEVAGAEAFSPLRLSAVSGIDAGHQA